MFVFYEDGDLRDLTGLIHPFPPGAPSDRTVRGEGPVENWPGRLSAEAEGLAGLEADFRVVDDGARLVVDGRALLRAAMPDRIRRTVGNEVGFEKIGRAHV